MMKFRRQQGSDSQKDFCIRFLHPIMGKPDRDGNYIKVIGNSPKVCFAAHHDTVHRQEGMQRVEIINDVMSLDPTSDSSCLGADCTTGIWLILEMIDAGIPGVYVIHSGEEIGCVGSSALVKRNPKWLRKINAVISFDRRGYDSIVTHQMGYRTCSDAFANSLEAILGLGMQPDPTGAYTDSNEYVSKVSECTNISVGYFNQHTKNETQDLAFASRLRDALIAADWSQLVFEREIHDREYDYGDNWGYYFRGNEETMVEGVGVDDDLEMFHQLVLDNPYEVALLLKSYFGNHYDLIDELYDYGGRPSYRSVFDR